MRRVQIIAAVLTASSLLLAGCGGDDKSTSDKPDSQKVAGSEKVAATWPLTGLPVTGDADVAKTYPVLVTKMDNTEASSPQRGLGDADLVVEELVEGGLTRLAAFYYSKLPATVGPVRSMRASDIGIVKPAKASVVTSGAAFVTIQRIKKAGIQFFPEGSPGLSRDNSRRAPYNVFADLKTVAKKAKGPAKRPNDYLPFGSEKDFAGVRPARTIAASFGGGHTTNWTYDGQGYVNQNSFAAKGEHFPADNVLVLRVKVGDAGYTDPAGNPVPETKLTGQGRALLFHGGQMVRGTWSKADLGSPLSLRTAAGALKIPAGRTWIELVPAANGNITFAAK